jgi:tetratricopeptide (TPR) repeat protein
VAGNPRIDELRKRLEKEPGSRLFAQLAEELRKEGELAEAIQVCRDGLQKQPNYPSARITLGRALLDTGDPAAARTEFETVLKGAPDNILASRFLGEALEASGDIEGARKRYRLTLSLAPGDKHVLGRLESLDHAPSPGAPAVPVRAAPAPPAPAFAPPPVPAVELPPIKLVDVEEDFELEKPWETPAVAPAPPAPPPPPPPVAAAAVTVPIAAPAPQEPEEESFEFDNVPRPRNDEPFEVPLRVPLVDDGDAARDVAPPAPPAPEEPIASATLAELYLNQGFPQRAIEVYQQVLTREPGNVKARARLGELEASLAAPPPGGPEPAADRRARLQRTIERLEAFRGKLQGLRP